MPLYEYDCQACGPFTAFQSVAHRDRKLSCPRCHRIARRSFSIPRLRLLAPATRQAHDVNERSRHEPGVRKSHQCSSGCGCGRPSTTTARVRKKSAPKRPWMLGH